MLPFMKIVAPAGFIKARHLGVQHYLASRGSDLLFGDPGDPPDRETICGLGNRKNLLFHDLLEKQGRGGLAAP